jgi:hypothetical protein
MKGVSKIIATLFFIGIGVLSFQIIAPKQSSYNSENEKGLQRTLTNKSQQILTVWGATRVASGVISLLQSIEVGGSFFVEANFNPLEFLASLDNVLDKTSDVCLYALGAILIEKLILALSGWVAFRIIIPIAMFIGIISIWIGKQKANVLRVLISFGIIGTVVCTAVPISVGLSQVIEKKIFTNEIQRTMNEINLKNNEVEGVQKGIEGNSKGLPKKILDSVHNFFENAKKLADALVQDVINYIMIFVVTNIIMPIATILGLIALTKYIVNLLLSPKTTASGA